MAAAHSGVYGLTCASRCAKAGRTRSLTLVAASSAPTSTPAARYSPSIAGRMHSRSSKGTARSRSRSHTSGFLVAGSRRKYPPGPTR